jgi:hypothetical protein
MTHYQPPQIGFSPATKKRLDYLGWPQELMEASDGDIALAYLKKRDEEDTRYSWHIRQQAAAVMVLTAVLVAVWAMGVAQ